MAATIKMVAERAGVSVATVSKYLNGGNVYKENAIRIQKAVDELDYKLNDVARSLKTNKSYIIGVLAASIQSNFIAEIISTLQCSLANYGYSTLIVDYQEDEVLEKKQLDVLLKKKVDGIVLFPFQNEKEIVHLIQKEKIPVLMIDNLIQDVECDAVVTNNRQGVYEAVKQLVSYNHSRIGMVTGPLKMYTARERLNGYLDALRDSQIEIDEKLIAVADYDIDSGYNCMKVLIECEERPTAVLVTNYYMAIGVLKVLHENNIRIPEDMSVISVDELEFSRVLDTPISSIKQLRKEMGDMAAGIIVDRIRGEISDFPKIVYLDTELIWTRSVRPI